MKTNEEYQQAPNHCPFCDSEEIETTEPLDLSSGLQGVVCLTCSKQWEDTYILAGYQPPNCEDIKI